MSGGVLVNALQLLPAVIQREAVENRDSYAVGNSLQSQSTDGIESQRETQTAAFTKPEKHWAPAPCVAACS